MYCKLFFQTQKLHIFVDFRKKNYDHRRRLCLAAITCYHHGAHRHPEGGECSAPGQHQHEELHRGDPLHHHHPPHLRVPGGEGGAVDPPHAPQHRGEAAAHHQRLSAENPVQQLQSGDFPHTQRQGRSGGLRSGLNIIGLWDSEGIFIELKTKFPKQTEIFQLTVGGTDRCRDMARDRVFVVY